MYPEITQGVAMNHIIIVDRKTDVSASYAGIRLVDTDPDRAQHKLARLAFLTEEWVPMSVREAAKTKR